MFDADEEDEPPRQPGARIKWHVLWVLRNGKGDHGLFLDRRQLSDALHGGFKKKEEARAHALKHPYHRSHDAWLFSARTGVAELVVASNDTHPHKPEMIV